jgi:hypothetical protein
MESDEEKNFPHLVAAQQKTSLSFD